MPGKIDVSLEEGKRRVFAGAIDWPGWCRSGKDADEALEALISYGPRYARAVNRAVPGFDPPADVRAFRIVERLPGDASTDFGVPGTAPKADARPLDAKELKRLQAFLKASWSAFDAAAKRAMGATLSKGPRGGGRELDAIVAHVFEADGAYLRSLGGRWPSADGSAARQEMRKLRRAILDTLASRARGEPLAPSRRTKPPWTPRYAVRRSAWHALDHAWEIEDRAQPERGQKK